MSASGVGGIQIPSWSNFPHVVNDSLPLQLWSVGPGTKSRRWALLTH